MRYVAVAIAVIVAAFALACRKGAPEKEPLPPPKIVKKIPSEASPLRKTYEAEELGKDMSNGAVTADPAASNQMALYVKPGDVKPGEYIAWGPYEEIAPGTYIARWRMKLAKLPTDAKPVLSLDISGHAKGDDKNYVTLVSKSVSVRDFPEANKYYTYDLMFDVKQPFVFELRTQYLQNVEVYIDWSSLELAQ